MVEIKGRQQTITAVTSPLPQPPLTCPHMSKKDTERSILRILIAHSTKTTGNIEPRASKFGHHEGQLSSGSGHVINEYTAPPLLTSRWPHPAPPAYF